MSSHADTLTTALHERVAAIGTSVGTAGRNFTRAVQGVAAATDVEDAMRACVDAVLAAEALHKAADDAVKAARDALQEALETSGAPAVQTMHHTASLKRQAAYVTIAHEASIPRSFYVETLDKRALKSALVDGIAVDGASLAQPNSMSLAIRARS
jgi:hypothetical protein